MKKGEKSMSDSARTETEDPQRPGLENKIKTQHRRLEGRNALVTGASRGIGKEIAIALAEEGANVAINYRSSEFEAMEVARAVDDIGGKNWMFQADVSDINKVEEMKHHLDKYFGNIDILINNAGINIDKLFVNMDAENWNKVISVNLNGVFNCIKIFNEELNKSEHARIINITSIVGQMGNIGQANYAASKAGIIGMTKSLAKEMARNKITVNAIAPGFIETDMVRGIPDNVKEKIIKQIPMRRFGRAEEVAKAVVFLASEDAAYITGHVLNVNGGMYL